MNNNKHYQSEGARLERLAIKAKLRRSQKNEWEDFDAICNWIDQRTKRFNKKKGGLGK